MIKHYRFIVLYIFCYLHFSASTFSKKISASTKSHQCCILIFSNAKILLKYLVFDVSCDSEVVVIFDSLLLHAVLVHRIIFRNFTSSKEETHFLLFGVGSGLSKWADSSLLCSVFF